MGVGCISPLSMECIIHTLLQSQVLFLMWLARLVAGASAKDFLCYI